MRVLSLSNFLAGVLVAVLLGFTVSARELYRFSMTNCGRTRCVKVDADKAWQTSFSPSFAFASARLTIFDKKSGKEIRSVVSRDAYYDAVIEKILLREPVSGMKTESYYDLRRQELVAIH